MNMDCFKEKKSLTCVVTGDPPSTTSDWLVRSLIQQVHWELDQADELVKLWTQENRSGIWLNIRCSVSISGFLSPGLWSFPVFSFWCLALQTHRWPHEGRFSNSWRQTWTFTKTMTLTSLAWGHIPAFWFVSPGPVSCSPGLSSLPAEMPPEPGKKTQTGKL